MAALVHAAQLLEFLKTQAKKTEAGGPRATLFFPGCPQGPSSQAALASVGKMGPASLGRERGGGGPAEKPASVSLAACALHKPGQHKD